MADQEAIIVTTAATKLVGADDVRQDHDGIVYVYNGAAAVEIYVGDSEVTTTTGTPVAATKTEAFRTRPGRDLYAIVASGSETVRILIR